MWYSQAASRESHAVSCGQSHSWCSRRARSRRRRVLHRLFRKTDRRPPPPILDGLVRRTANLQAQTAVTGATATLEELRGVDKRARDYLRSGQPLMASDVVFSEGRDDATTVAQQLEDARIAERAALE